MTAGRSYRDALEDIRTAAENAQSFVRGMTLEAFRTDDRTVYATVRALELIGEAAKQIPDGVQQASPNGPWRAMARMRDLLIHRYFRMDLEVVWKTLVEDLPVLLPEIERLLDES